MPLLPIAIRIRAAVAVVAATSVVVLAGLVLPGPAVAAGSAPLIDGSRPAPATVTVTIHAFLAPAAAAPRRPPPPPRGAEIAGSPAPCEDRARKLMKDRAHWKATYRWWFRARSTPDYLSRRATAFALRRGVANITRAANDCGRSDWVSATAAYLGTTDRRPAPGYDPVKDEYLCASSDGYSVIGFGRLPARIAGLTCIFSSGGRIIEADIMLNKRSRWATSLAGCDAAALIEAVATHEAGHAFGLGHVSESTHGRLTMSESLDGHCQNSESTLGKGDMLGLEAIY